MTIAIKYILVYNLSMINKLIESYRIIFSLMYREAAQRIIINELNSLYPNEAWHIGELDLLSDYRIAMLAYRILKNKKLMK